MQKPKYWIYNPKTNLGREVFYNIDFFKPMYTEIFVDGVFPSSDGETYFIKQERGWDGESKTIETKIHFTTNTNLDGFSQKC